MYPIAEQDRSGGPGAADEFPLSAVIASQPEPLAVSPSGDKPNIASLEILVANDTGAAFPFEKLVLSFNALENGWEKDGAELLTPEWSRCKRSATPPDGWEKEPIGGEAGQCVYRAGGMGGGRKGLKDGDIFRFHLSDIPVSGRTGVTTIGVQLRDEDDGIIAEREFAVGKFPSGYYLRDFQAAIPVISVDQAGKSGTTLTWSAPPDPTVTYTLSANGGTPRKLASTQTIFNTGPLYTTTAYQLTATHADHSKVEHTLLAQVQVVGGDITARNVTVNGELKADGGVIKRMKKLRLENPVTLDEGMYGVIIGCVESFGGTGEFCESHVTATVKNKRGKIIRKKEARVKEDLGMETFVLVVGARCTVEFSTDAGNPKGSRAEAFWLPFRDPDWFLER
ncbi:hypothetical protein J0910_18420 [Nocardiopsis sp. CNT-189]|uniref:hypothetical protein n=1 Tax=Nocardiopsis oceanisediminis TaxID=2816862 RepID=UPI003B321D39